MGLFNSNYNKPGPGVDKNAVPKKGLNLFYEIYFRKFWDIIKLNMLYLVTILPCFFIVWFLAGLISNRIIGEYLPIAATFAGGDLLNTANIETANMIATVDTLIRLFIAAAFTIFVGAGPMTAGFVYILKSFINEQPVFLVTDYFKAVKANWKQALPVWVIDVIIFTAAYGAINFYGSIPAPMCYLRYVLYLLLFFFTILHFFIYHLIVSYKMPFVQLYRNAALFAIPSFPFCLLAFAVCAFLMCIFPAITFTSTTQTITDIFGVASIMFWVFMLLGTCGFIIEFNTCRQVRKYIKEDPGVEEKENVHSR